MAEYAEREKRFNDDLPKIVGEFMRSVSMADGEARIQAVGITKMILELPNISIQQKISILNSDKPIAFGSDLPSVVYSEPRPLLAEDVTLKMSMNVHAATSSEKAVDSTSEGGGEATFGWGLLKVKAHMKASVSTHSTKKRDSDYSATMDMEMKMTRHPLPEGLAKSIDSMNEIAKSVNEINVALARREIERIVHEENAQLPEPKSDEDGEAAKGPAVKPQPKK